MPLRPAISLILLLLAMGGMGANVATRNLSLAGDQQPAKKPSPRPTPPPDGPNPNDPGGPGKISVTPSGNAAAMEATASAPTTGEIIARAFKAGNEALTAAIAAGRTQNSDEAIQQYTAAIAHYDEGLAADPEQSALLVNKAWALKGRGIERFNAVVRSKTLDETARTAALQPAKDDFKAAAETATKGAILIKAQPVPTDPGELQRYNANKYAALLTNAETVRLFVSKTDPTRIEAGLTAFKEYLAVETDPAKKAKAQLDLAEMLLDAGAADKALVEFKAILATQPDSPEANLGAGLALYQIGDKTKFQEAANYLQHFVDVAPDADMTKGNAKAILTEMKNTENVTPVKIPTKTGSKRP